MAATREICKCCGAVVAVGFDVPNDVWFASVPARWREDVLCLNCFTRFADESRIEWDAQVQFYPVSFVTHSGSDVAAALPPRRAFPSLVIYCDSAPLKTVGVMVGVHIETWNGERVAFGSFVNSKCPDQFAGECYSVLKAIECARQLGAKKLFVLNDRIGGFRATDKKRYAGTKYLAVAATIADQAGITVKFYKIAKSDGQKNLADRYTRGQQALGLSVVGEEAEETLE